MKWYALLFESRVLTKVEIMVILLNKEKLPLRCVALHKIRVPPLATRILCNATQHEQNQQNH